MHPVLRRTGELSKLLLSDLLPSAIHGQTKRRRSTPGYRRCATLEQWGCRIPWLGSIRGQTGVNRCKNFFTPYSIFLHWQSRSGSSGGVPNGCWMGFAPCRFSPVNYRHLLGRNFRQNVARSFSHLIYFFRVLMGLRPRRGRKPESSSPSRRESTSAN